MSSEYDTPPNGALVRHEVCEVPTTLPKERITFAQEAAKHLMTIVKDQQLSKNFGGVKDHLYYEAWNTIAEFYGYALGAEDSQPIGVASEKGQIVGFTAKGYVRRKSDGVILSTADSSCMQDEANWKNKPNYQLRSMAQTRAASKAARMLLSWVVVLAGYHPTPAEEMDGVVESSQPRQGTPVAGAVVEDTGETTKKPQFLVETWCKDHGVELAEMEGFITGTGTYKKGKNMGEAYNWYELPVDLWENGFPEPTASDAALDGEEEVPFPIEDGGVEVVDSDLTGGDSETVKPKSPAHKAMCGKLLKRYENLEDAHDWLRLKYGVGIKTAISLETYEQIMDCIKGW